MLSWLTGTGPQAADHTDALDSTVADFPETPAHLFAVKAFQHRLWGTPKPTQNQVATAAEEESPSKRNGILLTPGASTIKRTKTVTFDALEAKGRQAIGDVKGPAAFPGKFPSPWTPKVQGEPDLREIQNDKEPPISASRSAALTQALRDAKSDSSRSSKESDVSKRQAEPVKQTDSRAEEKGDLFWKTRFEMYNESTKREMKKLVMKQKAAKSFARDKDNEAMRLASELKQERQKVARLEQRVADLSSRLEEYAALLDKKGGTKDAEKIANRPAATATNDTQRPTVNARHRPQSTGVDLWADAVLSSPPAPEDQSRPVVKQTAANNMPLQSRDLNTLDAEAKSGPMSKPGQSTADKRPYTKRATPSKAFTLDFDSVLDLPDPSPQPSQRKTLAHRPATATTMDIESSAFMDNPSTEFARPLKVDTQDLVRSLGAKGRSTPRTTPRSKAIATHTATSTRRKTPAGSHQVVAEKTAGAALGAEQMIGKERAAKALARIEARRKQQAGLI